MAFGWPGRPVQAAHRPVGEHRVGEEPQEGVQVAEVVVLGGGGGEGQIDQGRVLGGIQGGIEAHAFGGAGGLEHAIEPRQGDAHAGGELGGPSVSLMRLMCSELIRCALLSVS